MHSLRYQKLEQTVRDRGAKAFRDGRDRSECPYVIKGKQGGKFRRLWQEGYDLEQHSAKTVLIIAITNH